MMILYSGNKDPFSHRCRIVLHEKEMDFEIIDVNLAHKQEDLAIINEYGTVPVLVERGLKITDSNIINEYIDERFPHPQLMPPDPAGRAHIRLILKDFEDSFFSHLPEISPDKPRVANRARRTLAENLTKLSALLYRQDYIFGNEFSMLDVAIAPLLWRLSYLNIELPEQATPLLKYAERIFSRPAFSKATTATEKNMRR